MDRIASSRRFFIRSDSSSGTGIGSGSGGVGGGGGGGGGFGELNRLPMMILQSIYNPVCYYTVPARSNQQHPLCIRTAPSTAALTAPSACAPPCPASFPRTRNAAVSFCGEPLLPRRFFLCRNRNLLPHPCTPFRKTARP
ncbi:MAG: hypothetical protein CUN56_00565 [Phototrophicales bacterium]|nr:MAG: hypothetical protein CUN56_00565 [Phototrophicales bacterium]